MPFRFEHLHTLAALVDEGSFEGAAHRLRVSTSAVSQRVRAMERSAGTVLVRRTTPVGTTAAGDVVLRHARQVVMLDEDTARALRAEGREHGRVRVPLAVNADSLATWFTEALAAVPEEAGVTFEVHREDEQHTAELLRAGTVMGAVTSRPATVQGCSTEPLGALHYRAACSPDFARKHLQGGREQALVRAPMVNYDRSDELQDRFVRALTGREAEGPRHYVPASEDFARAIVFGLGWGVVPEQQCAEHVAAGRLVDLAPERPVRVRLHWQRWNVSSPALDAVSEAVLAVAAEHLHSTG
ncbi:LysR family transcriptional regulator ArgP [Nocardiopsis sp. HNM0947]|uniref:LysR family transcriptional regulator ArgP n=1 Tax=Nocardiopsis coralli TaxID=2772213 RepID=A0ABR9P9E0_9ACTN|nr:LysR family transcriptional regulator ArgP [Nocardiopsis coralli]MBE3000456.1 LysR family transcriptional regulator ArgP [Nocardiopsis coralli]